MPNVIVHYVNGSTDTIGKPSFVAALDFARHGISYSGGRVRRVELETEPGSLRAVWDATWTAESRQAGLWAPC